MALLNYGQIPLFCRPLISQDKKLNPSILSRKKYATLFNYLKHSFTSPSKE